jgi:hypothetical protein
LYALSINTLKTACHAQITPHLAAFSFALFDAMQLIRCLLCEGEHPFVGME